MAEVHNLTGAVVITDNHRAHHSIRVRELFRELRCQLVFLPPSSSILNAVETVWSTTKRKLRKLLLDSNPKMLNQRWLELTLQTILSSFTTEELERHARSHYDDTIAVLKEAIAHYNSIPE